MRIGKLKPVVVDTPHGKISIGSRYRKSVGSYALNLYGSKKAIQFVLPNSNISADKDKVLTELSAPNQKITTLAEIERFRHAIIESIEDLSNGYVSEKEPEKKDKTLLEVLDDFIAFNGSSKKTKTNDGYVNSITRWANLFGKDLPVNEITQELIARKRDKILTIPIPTRKNIGGADRPRKPSSVNSDLKDLKAVLNYAYNAGVIKTKVWTLVKPLSKAPKIGNWWSPSEVKVVLETAKKDSNDALLIFSIALLTGVRKKELLDITWGDINRSDDTQWILRVKCGKGSKLRFIPVCKDLRLILTPYVSENEAEFVIKPKNKKSDTEYRYHFGKLFDRVVRDSKVKRIKIHEMRDSFASNLLASGVSVYDVASFCGHSSIATTEKHYAHSVSKNFDIDNMSVLDSGFME